MSAPDKVVRQCTSCDTGLTLKEIIYSCEYPETIPTRTGGKRKGTLVDAQRVWCGADCAKASYQVTS